MGGEIFKDTFFQYTSGWLLLRFVEYLSLESFFVVVSLYNMLCSIADV